ncbi:MAG: site-specific integrase [Campylobacterales bacterium]|nr:site-specific integrase [Campylobacterales bacterium]
MRVGEILGLQIADFKDDGFIHIKRTRTKGIIGSGKTNNAIRKVLYSSLILDEVKKIQPKDNIFIFGNIDDASLLRSQWRDVCTDAQVPKYKLYSTRHTFATLMLRENIVSINELAGLLGHSSAKVTLEYYASVIESKNIDFGFNFSLFGHDTVTAEQFKSV